MLGFMPVAEDQSEHLLLVFMALRPGLGGDGLLEGPVFLIRTH